MLSKYQELENQIHNIENQLKDMPPGTLNCARNGNYYKWYQSDGQNNIYIPKKKQSTAQQLALKKYLSLLLEDLSHEKHAIQLYLEHHSTTPKAPQLLNNPEFNSLISPHFMPLSQELSNWMQEIYERNTNYPDQLIHKSSSGNFLRSKSESIIDMLLHINRIPFRYECALRLSETVLFPDFTIRHPKTGNVYYWEHFGLMDNYAYAQNACSKLQLYTSHGIIPSIQLITTYETKDNPLNPNTVEKIITHYFR